MTKELQLPSPKIIAQADWMPSEDDAAQAPVGGVAWIFQGWKMFFFKMEI